MKEPKDLISVITVTEGRPEWAEWAWWNFTKQTYPNKELIIVCSGQDEHWKEYARTHDEIIFEITPPGTWVARKRNLGIKAATKGSLITWMDDDDWSWSRRLETVYEAFDQSKYDMIIPHGYPARLNMRTMKAQYPKISMWECSLSKYEVAIAVPFKEHVEQASDTHWLRSVQQKFREDTTWMSHLHSKLAEKYGTSGENNGGVQRMLKADHIFFWTNHPKNLVNRDSRKPGSGYDLKRYEQCSEEEWAETIRLLGDVRSKLYQGEAPR